MAHVGADACRPCHQKEYDQWSRTPHAVAFAVLAKDGRSGDPECLRCHTTGFGLLRGFGDAMATAVLTGVQCETCHGPGSLHAKDPQKKGLIVSSPKTELCTSCHHPPHVEAFDPKEKLQLVLGPGHGQPKK